MFFALVMLASGWRAFGHRAEGPRRARMESSPQYGEGTFHNPEPIITDWWASLTAVTAASPFVRPEGPMPVVTGHPERFQTPPASGLRVTWLGHASVLIELDGFRVLTDPAFSERSSPIQWLGPTRWYPPPVALHDLPKLDAVLISHDHYDHLDYGSVVALNERGVTFVVPLGLGAHLSYWGVPDARIRELDWWEHTKFGALDIACTPSRHASGRTLWDKDRTLWASYALIGPTHRVYFSGDTGLFTAMKTIGERFGPFDLTLIETGQYNRAWPDWHIGPEQAVEAHQMLRGKVMMPIHWTLFALAAHGWTEPAERVVTEAAKRNANVIVPKPGESVEPSTAKLVRWWPKLPYDTAAEHPIVSSQVLR